MGVREMDQFLERWQMEVKDLRRRMISAPTPRERERWYALLPLAQGWTASPTAEALEWDPHTLVIGFLHEVRNLLVETSLVHHKASYCPYQFQGYSEQGHLT